MNVHRLRRGHDRKGRRHHTQLQLSRRGKLPLQPVQIRDQFVLRLLQGLHGLIDFAVPQRQKRVALLQLRGPLIQETEDRGQFADLVAAGELFETRYARGRLVMFACWLVLAASDSSLARRLEANSWAFAVSSRIGAVIRPDRK